MGFLKYFVEEMRRPPRKLRAGALFVVFRRAGLGVSPGLGAHVGALQQLPADDGAVHGFEPRGEIPHQFVVGLLGRRVAGGVDPYKPLFRPLLCPSTLFTTRVCYGMKAQSFQKSVPLTPLAAAR